MASESAEVYDLLILVDATYSMGSYLKSLQTSLPQIIRISTLTDCFSRIGMLAYRDYCDKELLDWSGWLAPSEVSEDGSAKDLVAKAKTLSPKGGGDGPEATKTGLARAYQLMRADATTIILLFTDAPPHTFSNGSFKDRSSNHGAEQDALSNKASYGGLGPMFSDWVSATNMLHSGTKRAQVFSILQTNMRFEEAGYYHYLSAMTGGACFSLTKTESATISEVTVNILLSWMGAEKPGSTREAELPAYLSRYKDEEGMKSLKSEKDLNGTKFFFTSSVSSYDRVLPANEKDRVKKGALNITKTQALSDIMKYLPRKKTPVLNFTKRYATDAEYKQLAVKQLKKIINEDVSAMSLNPVFGSLWRAVCNDRDNSARDELVKDFGSKVDTIKDVEEKARMRTWLDESYDFTAEVMDTINSVPQSERFPCVCLDPTLSFTREADGDEEARPITTFSRDELLEIGRSCDYRILRRLGKVMSQLTFINSAAEMPTHIAAAPESEVPRIPMALAQAKYKRKFWKILLHIVVPGTMLAARPAALLAALSLKLGVQPLFNAAVEEITPWKDRWNNIEIPETWNAGCLLLLLSADEAYRKRLELEKGMDNLALDVSINRRPHSPCLDERPTKRIRLDYSLLTPCKENKSAVSKDNGLLLSADRRLFDLLVSYKLLESNLNTDLEACIGWSPSKTVVALGPNVICTSCKFPRSVTIMGKDGKCGHCLWTQYASEKERVSDTNANVSYTDNSHTPATWVECHSNICRAQYVVYQVARLNVTPKCHYCRNGVGNAPVLECSKCLNRVIYPEAYRPKDLKEKDFECYACASGRKTVVTVETTAAKLAVENGTGWLVRNKGALGKPFNKTSVFQIVKTAGTKDLCEKVELFPISETLNLTINGKLVRNLPQIIISLESWVTRRQTEQGMCSLCCSSMRKDNLLRACGRSGCDQRIDNKCLKGWYGLNAPGRIINTAALACAFCRRAPSAKTLSKYGMGIHAVGNLQKAVDEKGEWIYAWCQTCGHAKQYMERVCAGGAPAELSNWSCEACRDYKGDKNVKKCPGCGTWTEKLAGCDHITCIIPGCGAHWCFYCGKKQTATTIYAHMQKEHGGYYGEVDAEAEDVDTDY
jgi:hypothetical protein